MASSPGLFDSSRIYLDIDSTIQNDAWRQSQSLATSSSRWTAYLNQLCLGVLLPWLREDYEPQATPALSPPSLLSIWELVNGAPMSLGKTRLILIPTESIDLDEIRIPQEWVDIASWLGDYYLIVQVNPDDGWVRIVGFITHRRLKAQGQYDGRDRTYCLDDSNWLDDFILLWVPRQLHAKEANRTAALPLTALSLPQANQLIERLGNPSVLTPRLSVPFPLWGALLSHDGWRQRLTEKRWGLPEQRSVRQWLDSGVSNLARQVGWSQITLQPALSSIRGEEDFISNVIVVRRLAIAGQTYELRVLLAGGALENGWRFELHPPTPDGVIPAGFKLKLLTEDLHPFEGNEDTANLKVNHLFIQVELAPGAGIVWEIDPTPDQYEQEILRF